MLRSIFCIAAVMILALSCAQDKGNYVYIELEEPVIRDIGDISVLTHERLYVDPEVEGSEEYGYEWKAIDRNGGVEPVILGMDEVLDYEVTLTPGLYSLFFTVTDEDTGLFWQKEIGLTVSSSMSEGWMVLCSDQGRARLDFISMVTGDTYADVLSGNGMPQMNGPRRIQWLSSKTDESSPYYLLTDDGATRLGKDDFGWKLEFDFAYEVASQEKLIPYSIVSSGFGKVVVSGTKAHYCEIMGFDGLYGSAVNKDFAVAPYVGANALAEQVYAAVHLLYDTDAKRFMAYCPLLAFNDLGGLDPLADMDAFRQIADGMAPDAGVVGDAFDSWPVGMDMVYMENSRYDPGNGKMGMTYAVLKDAGGCHIYGIQLGDILRYADCTYVLGKGYHADAKGCTGLGADGNLFAFSSLKNYMYYSSGSTIFRVDLSQKPLKAEAHISLPGERITCMKFNLYQKAENIQRSYDLVVATEKDGQGILRIYEGRESDGDFTSVVPALYKGFAEIVDVEYKERVY